MFNLYEGVDPLLQLQVELVQLVANFSMAIGKERKGRGTADEHAICNFTATTESPLFVPKTTVERIFMCGHTQLFSYIFN